MKKKLAKRVWLPKIGAMTANNIPNYEDRDWLTFEEEMELAKEEREYMEDTGTLWEELND